MTSRVSIIITGIDHTPSVGQCVQALLRSNPLPEHLLFEVIVVSRSTPRGARIIPPRIANATTARNWEVDHCVTSGTSAEAMNLGDSRSAGGTFVYLDAGVFVEPELLPSLLKKLDSDEPRYVSAIPTATVETAGFRAHHNRYASTLPLSSRRSALGVFAVNFSGRSLWGKFPDVILPCEFARLHFPANCQKLAQASFANSRRTGFSNLVGEQRRLSMGRKQLEANHFDLTKNNSDTTPSIRTKLTRALSDPLGFGAHAVVLLAEKSPLHRTRSRWFNRNKKADSRVGNAIGKRFRTWPFLTNLAKRSPVESSASSRL